MGYRWQENPDNPELEYDLLVFKQGYAFFLKVRVLRYHIRPDAFYEDLLEDDLREVRALLFPQRMLLRDLVPHPARAYFPEAPGL